MHKLFTKQLITRAFVFCASVFVYIQSSNAQIDIMFQDFEISPVTNIHNSGDLTLIDGPSPCGKASRGDTTDFNSASVDFSPSTYFLGLNPQAPCGGFYTAVLYSDTLDFNGFDSAFFDCRYYITSTLNWGPVSAQIIFTNGAVSDTIDTEFSSTDSWEGISIKLSNGLLNSQVMMRINMGGGEGVGFDNMQVYGFQTLDVAENAVNSKMTVYPNPSSDYINISSDNDLLSVTLMDLSGKVVLQKSLQKIHKTRLDINSLPNGVYLLVITDDKGNKQTRKVITHH